MHEIPNHQLTHDQIPDPNAEDLSWIEFAHTFNGYEAAGSLASFFKAAGSLKMFRYPLTHLEPTTSQ